jgi:hypothetical protein
MIQRRAYHAANPPAELPAWMDPGLETTEPDGPADDAVFQAAVAEAMREYAAAVTSPQAEPPQTPPNPATPLFEPALSPAPSAASTPGAPTLAATTPATAIREATQPPGFGPPSSRPNPGMAGADQPRTTPYKTTLLRHAAMPPAAIRSTG